MNLEENLINLETIIKKLESKDLTINDSLDLFSEGINLSKQTLVSLKETKGKLEALNFEIDKLSEELKNI